MINLMKMHLYVHHCCLRLKNKHYNTANFGSQFKSLVCTCTKKDNSNSYCIFTEINSLDKR